MAARRNGDGARARLVQRALMAALVLVCVSSDAFLAQQTYLKDSTLLRHLIDSSAHGAVAFCCWGVFLCQTEREQLFATSARSSRHQPDAAAAADHADSTAADDSTRTQPWLAFLKRCVFAGVVAALLDVDHFIAAGSFSISGATHLKHRPFGHAVTFIAALALVVYKSSSKHPAAIRTRRVCFVIVALLSHQLRDGMRLGVWFWPLGSTPPIEYLLYLLMEEALPFAMGCWQNRVAAKDQAKQERGGFEAIAQDDGDADDGEDQVELRVITIRGGSDENDESK